MKRFRSSSTIYVFFSCFLCCVSQLIFLFLLFETSSKSTTTAFAFLFQSNIPLLSTSRKQWRSHSSKWFVQNNNHYDNNNNNNNKYESHVPLHRLSFSRRTISVSEYASMIQERKDSINKCIPCVDRKIEKKRRFLTPLHALDEDYRTNSSYNDDDNNDYDNGQNGPRDRNFSVINDISKGSESGFLVDSESIKDEETLKEKSESKDQSSCSSSSSVSGPTSSSNQAMELEMTTDDEQLLAELRAEKQRSHDFWQYHSYLNSHSGVWSGIWSDYILSTYEESSSDTIDEKEETKGGGGEEEEEREAKDQQSSKKSLLLHNINTYKGRHSVLKYNQKVTSAPVPFERRPENMAIESGDIKFTPEMYQTALQEFDQFLIDSGIEKKTDDEGEESGTDKDKAEKRKSTWASEVEEGQSVTKESFPKLDIENIKPLRPPSTFTIPPMSSEKMEDYRILLREQVMVMSLDGTPTGNPQTVGEIMIRPEDMRGEEGNLVVSNAMTITKLFPPVNFPHPVLVMDIGIVDPKEYQERVRVRLYYQQFNEEEYKSMKVTCDECGKVAFTKETEKETEQQDSSSIDGGEASGKDTVTDPKIDGSTTSGQETNFCCPFTFDRLVIIREKQGKIGPKGDEDVFFGAPGKGIYDDCNIRDSVVDNEDVKDYSDNYENVNFNFPGGLSISFPRFISRYRKGCVAMDWTCRDMRYQVDRRWDDGNANVLVNGSLSGLELTEIRAEDAEIYKPQNH